MAGMFHGRVALVTGAASGIGRASAMAFARDGASVIVADVQAEGGEETVAQIRVGGGDALFVQTDVTRPADVERLVHQTVTTYGRLDFAHNNAGIEGPLASLLDYPDDAFDRVIAVNLKGVWLCLKQELRQMLAQGGGAIVNTASVAGLRGSGMQAAYAASKHGVLGLTRSSAQTYGARGIRINAVCPGVIQTPMLERADQFTQGQFSARSIRAHPIGRLGTADDVAAAVVWLCSDAAAFVTGVSFPVDGGLMA
ncbi:MAG: SDR family oxidoreductase [Dehalococcoidia bacterium]